MQVIVKNFETTGSYENKPRPGRPPKLNERIQRRILREINEHPMENAVSIAKGIEKDYGIAVHAETVRRSLKKNGLNCRVARRKPLWRDVNISKRLNYAQKYQNTHQTDPTFWERVIFTDECKFNIFGSDGHAKVWRKKILRCRQKMFFLP